MLNIFEVLDIKEQEIFTKIDCEITINKTEYDGFFTEYHDRFQIPGVIEIYFPELEDYTQIITNYNIIGVMKSDDYDEDKSYIIIKYKSGDKIVEQKTVDVSTNLPLISQMLNGKLTYVKSPEALVNIMHTALPGSDLVHLELIISNIFRDNVTEEPARLTGDYSNASQVGVLQLGKTTSWLSAIAFQHIDQGITKALVSNKPAKMNPIEKVLNEDFDF